MNGILDGSLITTQVPVCGYLQTLSFTSVPSFITTSPGEVITYEVGTSNIANVGSHTITVTSTLNEYTYTAPSPPCQSTFVISVSDPCTTTTIMNSPPSVVENFVAFAGY
jgi:hypothetical protein